MKILKILFIIILLFVFTETAFRIFMPGYVRIVDNRNGKRIWLSEVIESSKEGKRFKPNLDLTVYNAWISHIPKVILRTNSFGFRDNEIDIQNMRDEYRVLVLGDSITWAGYLPEEDTFVFELGKLFSKYENRNIRTINAALGDVGLTEEIEILKQCFDKINPKTVILEFYLNDSRPPVGFESERRLSWAKFLQKSRFIDFLYNNAQIQLFLMRRRILGNEYRYRWFYLSRTQQWKTDTVFFNKMVREADLDWGAAWVEDSWGVIEKGIQELNKFALEKGFNLIVVCFPVSFQVYADFLNNSPQERIRNIAEKYNIPFLDLLPRLRANNKINLFYDHCHLNIEGHSIVAQELYQFLITNKLI